MNSPVVLVPWEIMKGDFGPHFFLLILRQSCSLKLHFCLEVCRETNQLLLCEQCLTFHLVWLLCAALRCALQPGEFPARLQYDALQEPKTCGMFLRTCNIRDTVAGKKPNALFLFLSNRKTPFLVRKLLPRRSVLLFLFGWSLNTLLTPAAITL